MKMIEAPKGALVVCKKVKDPLFLSVVIPTLNEEKTIVVLIEKLVGLLDKEIKGNYEIIVVDDDSQDLTWKKVFTLTSKYLQLKVIRRVDEKGLATAVIRGWQVARGNLLAVMDGDLKHSLEPFVKMVKTVENGVDLVIGSRYKKNQFWFSLSHFAKLVGLILLPKVVKKTTDPTSGYFVVKREAISSVEFYPVGYKIMLEIMARGNVSKIEEVEFTFQPQRNGHSKIIRKQDLAYLQHLLRLRVASLPVIRYSRWFLVGSTGYIVDIVVFYLLFSLFSLPLTISTIISTELALINNFIWNDRWTFGDISSKIPSSYQKGMRFWRFNLICLSGLVFHVFILRWFVLTIGMNPYVAKTVTILIVAIWNIILNFRFNWHVQSDCK